MRQLHGRDPTVREILIDPKGRYAQYSDPQGHGSGFADEQIHQPAAGKWTLLIFGRTTSIYEGKVSYEETTQKFRTVKGAVKPASKVVGPGKSTSFAVRVPAPATPGFWTGAVVFHSNRESKLGTIPVVSEAKVPVAAKKAGHFNGTLIGGNGRPGVFAQELSYEFTVPKGVHDLDVNVHASHDGYQLVGQLIDPHGNAVDSQIGFNKVNAFGPDNTNAVQLVWADPAPGTWRVNVANGQYFYPGVYSGLTHATLKGTVSFNTSRVSVTGMPTGTLAPGSHVTAHIKVKNTGVEPETYQLDPRTTSQTPYDGVSLENTSGHPADHFRRLHPGVRRTAVQQPADAGREHDRLDADHVRHQPVLGLTGHRLPRQRGSRVDEHHGQQSGRLAVGDGHQ